MRAHCFQHVPFEGLGSIEGWLDTAGARISTTRFYTNDTLPALADVDLLVVMGGPMSVNDDLAHPWLSAERQFIRAAIEGGKAVLGVCLGAQLIASAMGARVFPNHEREIGWLPITGVAAVGHGPAWTTRGVASTVFHWHGDTFDLPDGAVHLARSAGCEHQAFRIGDRAIGLQFHLETTPASARDIVSHCRGELTSSRFVQSEAAILAADDARYAAINRLMAETLDDLTR